MTLRRSFTLLLYPALLLLLTECRNKVHPEAPKAEGFDPPIPPSLSYLAGSVVFELQDLEAKINKELDPVLVGNDSLSGNKATLLPMRVVRSGPVQIEYVNEQVRFSAPLQIWLVNPLRPKAKLPKKPFCSMHVNFGSKLAVSPNWRLATKVDLMDYKWITKPEIRILGQEISLANTAEKILTRSQPAIEKAINSAVYQELRLDKMVTPIWRDIQKPLRISKQYNLWLLPRPISVAAGAISGNGRTITIPLHIAFETQTELKEKPTQRAPSALPPLQKRQTVPQVSEIMVMSFIPYADLNRVLNELLQQQQPKMTKNILTVKGAETYGGQRTLIVKTDVSGIINGSLYLRGRPAFDTLSNTLRVGHLDFDAQTEESLPKPVDRLWHKSLRTFLESMLSVQLGQEIGQLPRKIDEAFEKSGAGKKTDLTMKSFRFVPQKVAVRPDGIQALIRVESKVTVQVKQL